MTFSPERRKFHQQLEQLACGADPGLLARYAFRYLPPERPGLYRRARMAVGRVLRNLGLRTSGPLEPWLPGLKHFPRNDDALPVVIWAIGAERDALREACRHFATLQATLPRWVPVLVTDVTDFAFFSRLGWLVEYVPKLASSVHGYAERKQQYLAWRYRDARALPVSALNADAHIEEWLFD